jgi:hypothetical protein
VARRRPAGARLASSPALRSAFDGYNRGRQWAITCAEVDKLKLARTVDRQDCGVIALASGDPALALYSDRNEPEHQ